MNIHFYTMWAHIEEFQKGNDIIVWAKEKKGEGDLHVDINVNHYNIEAHGDEYSFLVSKNSQIEMLLNQINRNLKIE